MTTDGSDTRPITNMSPWAVAWDSIRYDETQPIRDQFPKSMHGARRGCERHGVSLDLALDIEEAHLRALEMCGIIVDKAKFFDTLSRDLCYKLMRMWGSLNRTSKQWKACTKRGSTCTNLTGPSPTQERDMAASSKGWLAHC